MTGDARRDALADALADVVHAHAESDADRGIVTGFVCAVETCGADGHAYLRLIAGSDMPAWRQLGLVDYAAQLLRDTTTQA